MIYYFMITVILIITSFILGRITSPARFHSKDKVWLEKRLKDLGNTGYVEPVKKGQSMDSTAMDSFTLILDQHRKTIRTVFFNDLLYNMKHGICEYSSYSDKYNLLPKDSVVMILNELITEVESKNPGLSLKGSLLGGRNPKVDIRINQKKTS